MAPYIYIYYGFIFILFMGYLIVLFQHTEFNMRQHEFSTQYCYCIAQKISTNREAHTNRLTCEPVEHVVYGGGCEGSAEGLTVPGLRHGHDDTRHRRTDVRSHHDRDGQLNRQHCKSCRNIYTKRIHFHNIICYSKLTVTLV